jgi:hypothetical protein
MLKLGKELYRLIKPCPRPYKIENCNRPNESKMVAVHTSAVRMREKLAGKNDHREFLDFFNLYFFKKFIS